MTVPVLGISAGRFTLRSLSGFGISAAVLHRLTRVRANYGSSARARAFRSHPSLARCLSRHLTSRAVSCCTLMQISCSASYLAIRYRAARLTHVSLLHVLALHCQEGCCGCSPPARRSRACTWLSLCHTKILPLKVPYGPLQGIRNPPMRKAILTISEGGFCASHGTSKTRKRWQIDH